MNLRNAHIKDRRGLKVLRKRIDQANIPKSVLDETLNIATWNIRQFCKGQRSALALRYIAEIIGAFDLVSVVELGAELSQLRWVMDLLGPDWDVVYSDYISDPGAIGSALASCSTGGR